MMQWSYKGGEVYIAESSGCWVAIIGYGFTVNAGTTVTLTGWHDGNYYYIEEMPGYVVELSTASGWKKHKGFSYKSQAQAQDVVNGLLQNNKYIYENNLLLSRFADKMSAEEKETLYYLQKRLEVRETQLREAEVFSELQEARIMGYANYQGYLNAFMSNYSQGIGLVISTTTAIIIGAVVLASLSSAAYFAFKAAYEESKQDVELSRKMLKVFEKYNMTDEDIALIEKETQGIVTRKVLLEKINNFIGNTKKLLLIGLAAYAGYNIYNQYIKK